MTIETLSRETQLGLRRWAAQVHGDDMLFDDNASSPEFWAWVTFQLWMSRDRPEWFPKGKSATIQAIEAHLYKEALQALPEEMRTS